MYFWAIGCLYWHISILKHTVAPIYTVILGFFFLPLILEFKIVFLNYAVSGIKGIAAKTFYM